MKRMSEEARSLSIEVVDRLTSAGHTAYWAGGCVRDLLLGLVPKDYDVATSARPEEVQRLFRRTIAIGASFGVITVIGGPSLTVEVATFRSDGDYSDGRRPDRVHFCSAEEDARRRDFTINGMFFDPFTKEVIDFVGGQQDLIRRVIRAIGDPEARFGEDKLRMLRAIRFAGQLSFTMDEATHRALVQHAQSISVVSVERILAEQRQILEHPSRASSLEALWGTGLFQEIYPELVAVGYDSTALSASRSVMARQPSRGSLPWGMAAMLSPLPLPLATRLASEILRRQRASNDDIERAAWLVAHRDLWRDSDSARPHQIKRVLAQPGRAELLDLWEAIEGDQHAEGRHPQTDRLRQMYDSWGPDGVDPPVLLTGEELIAWGYRPGKLFKEILHTVRNRQLDGELDSAAEAESFVRANWPAPG
jgi:tRNA nucleotidyltransferase/poly(A) polymerase